MKTTRDGDGAQRISRSQLFDSPQRRGSTDMKLHYDPETDSLYIDLNDRPGVDAYEVIHGLVVDLDADGRPVGIDIQHASRDLDLQTLPGLARTQREDALNTGRA
jgi:uncharacterized protein YuzE